MSDPLGSQRSKEELARYFTALGAPGRVWGLIRGGLDLSITKQRELYFRACQVAASQILEKQTRIELCRRGLNVLYGFIDLPDRSPQDR